MCRGPNSHNARIIFPGSQPVSLDLQNLSLLQVKPVHGAPVFGVVLHGFGRDPHSHGRAGGASRGWLACRPANGQSERGTVTGSWAASGRHRVSQTDRQTGSEGKYTSGATGQAGIQAGGWAGRLHAGRQGSSRQTEPWTDVVMVGQIEQQTGRKAAPPQCQTASFFQTSLCLSKQNRRYYVTWKADGTRYMMLLRADGTYLIDRSVAGAYGLLMKVWSLRVLSRQHRLLLMTTVLQ